ncbi:MAG TPA: hypothetical protein PK854_09200 [Oscillospiraceae bacterium]|nr:hypothetical protein [Oscillospiraceae bacterium]HPS35429.1 hypothetical protein [Oscillospiraceae bacterium]
MKKTLKLAGSILLCAAILLGGCASAPSTSLPNELNEPNNKGNLMEFNMIAPSFFLSTEDVNSAAEKDVWLEEAYLRFGVRFNIVSDSYSAKDKKYSSEASYRRYKVLSGAERYTGFVAVNMSQLYTAVDKENATPLEDYLSDNQTWNALPQTVKNAFLINGHIYAIPASYAKTPKARAVTDSALALTGITVTNLDSLKDFALAYQRKTGKSAISSDGLANLDDILSAFGLYTGEDSAFPFAYDPLADSIVDFLIKGEAVTAFEYLRELYNAGALKINFDTSSITAPGDFKDGTCESYYGYYQDYENCTEVLTLNPENPQMVYTKSDGYMLTKDTPQPKETINLLVDMLFGSEQNYLDCWLGSSDNYSKNSDGTFTVKKIRISSTSYAIPAMPNLVSYIPDVFPCSKSGISYSQNGIAGKPETGPNQFPAVYNELVSKSKVRATWDPWKMTPTSAYLYSFQNDIFTLYNTCIKDAITDNSRTVGQIIKTYKEGMLNLGGNTLIDLMNASNSKHAVYYYFN